MAALFDENTKPDPTWKITLMLHYLGSIAVAHPSLMKIREREGSVPSLPIHKRFADGDFSTPPQQDQQNSRMHFLLNQRGFWKAPLIEYRTLSQVIENTEHRRALHRLFEEPDSDDRAAAYVAFASCCADAGVLADVLDEGSGLMTALVGLCFSEKVTPRSLLCGMSFVGFCAECRCRNLDTCAIY